MYQPQAVLHVATRRDMKRVIDQLYPDDRLFHNANQIRTAGGVCAQRRRMSNAEELDFVFRLGDCK